MSLVFDEYQYDEIHLSVIVFVLGFLYCNGECECLIAVVSVATDVTLLGSLDFAGACPSYECFPCNTYSTFHC